MNVTREIVNDLLPVFFSGEASEDTRRLVEEYFLANPDYERIVRKSATPLEALRMAAPAAAEAEREKRELQCIGWELRSRWAWLAMAVYFTLLPFVPLVSTTLGTWLGAPHTWGTRIATLPFIAFFWVLYFVRPARRNLPLVAAIFESALETALILIRLGIIPQRAAHPSNLEIVGIGALGAFFWILHFLSRGREKHAR